MTNSTCSVTWREALDLNARNISANRVQDTRKGKEKDSSGGFQIFVEKRE